MMSLNNALWKRINRASDNLTGKHQFLEDKLTYIWKSCVYNKKKHTMECSHTVAD